MKYVCLCYDDEKTLKSMPRQEWDGIVKETYAVLDDLRGKGYLLDAKSLEWVNQAATVRIRNGKMSVTDGPFAETKEQLGGFFLIEARDLNEAIQVASKFTGARLGCIEVRPVRELANSETEKIS